MYIAPCIYIDDRFPGIALEVAHPRDVKTVVLATTATAKRSSPVVRPFSLTISHKSRDITFDISGCATHFKLPDIKGVRPDHLLNSGNEQKISSP